MAGESYDTDIEGEILAAELRADTDHARCSQEFLLQFEITECLAVFIALSGKLIVVASRGHLDGFQAGFGGGAANDQ